MILLSPPVILDYQETVGNLFCSARQQGFSSACQRCAPIGFVSVCGMPVCRQDFSGHINISCFD